MQSNLRIDASALNRRIEQTLSHTKRNSEAVLNEVARGVVRRLLNSTPPARKGKEGKAAQRAGKRTVAAQIGKILEGVPANRAEQSDIRSVHKAARIEGRIVGGKRSNRIKVPIRALKAFIKAAQARVGYLVAGWKRAAQKLKVNVPAWIEQHNAPGEGLVIPSGRGIKVVLRNSVGYASGLRNLTRRVNAALRGQDRAMANRLKNMVERAAQQAGLGN